MNAAPKVFDSDGVLGSDACQEAHSAGVRLPGRVKGRATVLIAAYSLCDHPSDRVREPLPPALSVQQALGGLPTQHRHRPHRRINRRDRRDTVQQTG